MLHIIKCLQYDVINGPGVRCSIWLAGCNNHCKNCWSQQTWNPTEGLRFNNIIENIKKCVNNPRINGISILGGDPLYWIMNKEFSYPDKYVNESIKQLYELLNICRESNKSIWLWTGYTYEDILRKNPKVLNYIDVLIDGRFEEDNKDLTIYWAGSSNQRLIDVKKSLTQNKIIIYGH